MTERQKSENQNTASQKSDHRAKRRLAAILVADVVGYSRRMREDETATLARLRALRGGVLEPRIAAHGGRLVKTMGDGLLIEFPSAVDAVDYAVAVQRALADPADPDRLQLRIGINVGDVVIEDGDLFGDGVNVAARLEARADPGGICLSGTAHEQVRHKLDLPFESMGRLKLTNIAEPVPAFRVRLGGEAGGGRMSSRPRRLPLPLGLATILVLAGLAAWWAWWPAGTEPGSSPGEVAAAVPQSDPPTPLPASTEVPTPDRRLTIAVLPFTMAGEAASEDWLGEGIAESVMTELSRFRDLAVVARNASFRHGGAAPDITALRTALGADFVLTGSVRRQGDDLRIAAQLVDARTGINSWAERYDRSYREIFAVEEEIVSEIVLRLVSEARRQAASHAAQRDVDSLEAYELVLRARQAYYRFDRDSAIEAMALIDQAIETAPDFAAAWELRSRLLVQFYIQPYDERRGDPALIDAAIAAGERAIRLDPGFSTARATLGAALMWDGQYDQALAELEQAIASNPLDTVALGVFADTLSRAGRHAESLQAFERLQAADPQMPLLNRGLVGRTLVMLGEYERALEYTRPCVERAPMLFPCLVFHAAAAAGAGDEAEAAATTARMLAINPSFTVDGYQRTVDFAREEDTSRMGELLLAAGVPR